jgi:hypothetical protein
MLVRRHPCMPWPERDFVTRLLAGIVGGLLGAIIGFFLAAGPFRSLNNGNPPPLVLVWGTAAVAFAASFWRDSAVRLLLRVLGSCRPGTL